MKDEGYKQFLIFLRLTPDYQIEANWCEADNEKVAAHVEMLRRLKEAGKLIVAGRTQEALDHTFGIIIIAVYDEAEAAGIMREDPAVAGGIMEASLHPFQVAVSRG